MSAARVMPCVLTTALAVADPAMPMRRARPIGGLAFYRKHSVGLLRRYLSVSMELGRTPCLLGNMVLRGRVSSYRMKSFEDLVIFIFDVEKCLKQLDRPTQAVITHVALEDYTVLETATITGDSQRSVSRMYGEGLDRLTQLFLQYGLLDPELEKLSRGEAKNQSNEVTKQRSCSPQKANKVGAIEFSN
jgi:hypothetical protein